MSENENEQFKEEDSNPSNDESKEDGRPSTSPFLPSQEELETDSEYAPAVLSDSIPKSPPQKSEILDVSASRIIHPRGLTSTVTREWIPPSGAGFGKMSMTIGEMLAHAAESVGFAVVMLFRAFGHIVSIGKKFNEIIKQLYLSGFQSTPLLIIVTMFTGMVISFATGTTLKQFRQEQLVAFAVTYTMFTQFGPIWTAIVLGSRVGASIAAEIGTMKVSEEIDALEVMCIDPIYFLVMPRLVALIIICPLLTILGSIMGSLGGALIAKFQFGLDYQQYFIQAKESIGVVEVFDGLLKALVFGVIVITVSCAMGLRTHGGAAGVGKATRTTVVLTLLMVVMFNYFITVIMDILKPVLS